jgi:hypothetical protein
MQLKGTSDDDICGFNSGFNAAVRWDSFANFLAITTQTFGKFLGNYKYWNIPYSLRYVVYKRSSCICKSKLYMG